MAKQHGAHKLIGTIDDITYYETAESGLLARKKTSLNKERFLTDPALEPVRQECSEFGRGSLAAILARDTLKAAGRTLNDTRIHSRLSGLFRRVIATDTTHEKGQRTLEHADFSRLLNFQWNKTRPFDRIYNGEPRFSIDPAIGLMEIDIPEIDGPANFDPAPGSDHVMIVLEGAAFDFQARIGLRVKDSTDWLSIQHSHPGQSLHGIVDVQPGMRMVLGIGIIFGQLVNGKMSVLNNKQHKGFTIGAVI